MKLAWLAGNPAAVHAATADVADPSFTGAQESSKGAFGPTPSVDQGPQTSYAMIAKPYRFSPIYT